MESCSSNIEKACGVTIEEPTTCNETTTAFEGDFIECNNKDTNSEYCSCIEVLDFDPVQKCKKTINDAFKKSNDEKKTCLKGFQECKRNIAKVLEVINECDVPSPDSPTTTTTAQAPTTTTTVPAPTPSTTTTAPAPTTATSAPTITASTFPECFYRQITIRNNLDVKVEVEVILEVPPPASVEIDGRENKTIYIGCNTIIG